jgi:hypothetical protein
VFGLAVVRGRGFRVGFPGRCAGGRKTESADRPAVCITGSRARYPHPACRLYRPSRMGLRVGSEMVAGRPRSRRAWTRNRDANKGKIVEEIIAPRERFASRVVNGHAA